MQKIGPPLSPRLNPAVLTREELGRVFALMGMNRGAPLVQATIASGAETGNAWRA